MGRKGRQSGERRHGSRRAIDRALLEAHATSGRILTPVLVALLSLAASLLAAWALWGMEAAADRARFTTLCERLQGELVRRVRMYRYGLMGARGVFAASQGVERDEFRRLVAARELASEFPGARGIGYIHRVRREDLPAFIEHVRADGAPEFEIRHDNGGAVLYVIQYIEPWDGNAEALGLDIAFEESRRSAADAAMRAGDGVMTGPITLAQAEDKGPGFLYLVPVYRNGALTMSESERIEALVGWLYMPLVADGMFAGSSEIADGQIDFEVFDGSTAERDRLLYDDDGHIRDAMGDPERLVTDREFRGRRLHEFRQIAVGRRVWTVAMSTTPQFETTSRMPAVVVALGGSGLGVLLACFVYVQNTSLRRARVLAESMTDDLRRLAVVAERTTNAVIITDTQRRIVWVNDGFTRITGYTPDDVLGRVPGDVLQCDRTEPETVRAIGRALSEGRAFRGEILNRGKDGRQYWLDIDIQPLRDDRGNVAGFMAVESEITPLVEQRRALAAGEARFRSMVEGADVVVWELDVEANAFTYVSPRALSMGYTLDQWKRPGFWRERLHPEDREEAEAFCASQVAQGRPHRFQYRMLRADGREAWIDDFVSAPDVVEGRKFLRGVMVDITERVRDQAQIAELKERFEAAIDGTSDGLFDWCREPERMWYSPRVWGMLGYDAQTAPSNSRENFHAHIHPDDLPRLHRAFDRHIVDGEPLDVEFRVRMPDRSYRWFRKRGDSRRDQRGRVVRISGSIQDVHEKREAEEALRIAQERWDFALTGSGDGVWDWDVMSGTVSYSKRWKEMLGHSEDEIDARLSEWDDRVHPDDRPAKIDGVQAHLDGQTPAYRAEYRMRCRDGSWMWVLDRGMVVRRNHAGRAMRMVGTISDISERKRLEDEAAQPALELAKVNQALEEAQSVCRLGSWSYDRTTGQVSWSRQIFRLFGRDPALGVPPLEEALRDYADSEVDRLKFHFERALESGTPYSLLLRTRLGHEGVRWVRAEGRARRDDSGAIVGLFGTAMDVTAEVEREEALSQSKALLSTILDILPQRVFWKDREGRYLGANRGFLCDAGVEGVVGKTDYDMPWTREQAESFVACDRRVMERDEPELEILEQITTAEGCTAWLSTSKVPLHDADGQVVGVLGTYSDVTTQHEHAEELRRAKAEAEASNRSKSEFLANMSHEIRTPMTAILGYAELLESDGDKSLAPKDRLEYIDTIKRNGQHLLTIINDILDLSKIEAGKLAVEHIQTDPRAIARDAAGLMRVKAEAKGLTLGLEFDGDLPAFIRSDPVRLRQILVNLLGNAIKFTEVGGVTVRLGMHPQRPETIRCDVIDTGIGIGPEALRRLFGAFSQADNSTTRRFGGTGLGLQISRRLATMLGGDIEVESRPGVGSRFTLTIGTGPLMGVPMVSRDSEDRPAGSAEPAAPTPTAQARGSAARPLEGLRILVAEDGPDNQRLIAFHLKKAGATYTVVANGLLAVEAVREQPHGFDVVLMDMQMPEMDGYTAAAALRSEGCTLPIIALTAHAMAGDREKCVAAGCTGYLTKPIDREALCRELAMQAARESPRVRRAA